MKRAPRPNVRKRRGRRWIKKQRADALWQRNYRRLMDQLIMGMAKATGAVAKALDEECRLANERLRAKGIEPSGRSMRIPFIIKSYPDEAAMLRDWNR